MKPQPTKKKAPINKNKIVKKKKANTPKKKKPPVKKVVVKEPKRRKIRYKRILFIMLILSVMSLIGYGILQIPIQNIYIKGNITIKDQTIIELASLENYPSIIENSLHKIKTKLEKNIYFKEVKVKRRGLRGIQITVTENTPLFFNLSNKKTILSDGIETDEKWAIPVLVNYVPDTIYQTFMKQMGQLDRTIAIRISEIKYNPNEVDKERFLLTMNDGNLVYLTLPKFDKMNNYIEIIRKFEGKKGILYLDYGTRFEVKEGK